MKNKEYDPNDQSVSALACGCDPRENHKCAEHSGDRKCVLGHWIRKDNCPACQVLKGEEK